MASDIPQLSENGAFEDDLKTRKSLRSAVITENDPLKIKLKISKKDIMESAKTKRESLSDTKFCRTHRNSAAKFDDKNIHESLDQEEKGNNDESKRKLRSKKEVDDEGDQKKEFIEEGNEDKKKKIHKGNDMNLSGISEFTEKPVKTRGRRSKLQIEASERLERRRFKRPDMGPSDDSKMIVDHIVSKESFCWTCHKDGSVVKCDTCPRVFHLKCVSLSKDPSKDWICPECSLVLHAEKMSTRSEAMKNLSLDQLCTLLNFAIGRMKNVPESQAFWKAVDPKEVPFYDKYITNPMDLNLLKKNIKAKMYGSPQAFLADAKWLLHNSIIFNSTQSSLTSTARSLVKICKQEMAEIENCPDCYLNAHTKKDWFVEVCRKPHILIWARLKGFPFWPAKAMSTNLKTQSVDARFFGAHDKAWVPVKECYLYSKNSPQLISKKRTDLDEAFLEADSYIKKIKQKYGTFCYASDKTPFVPEMYDKQLKSMIPSYQEEKISKKKRKRQTTEENGISENMQSGKRLTEHGSQHRFKLKRFNSEESHKVSEDICFMSDDVSDEKILSDDKISPEDEIARSLEMYDTADRVDGQVVDDNSTDPEEDGSVPIPEHGYSRLFDTEDGMETVSSKKSDDSGIDGSREESCGSKIFSNNFNKTNENQTPRTDDESVEFEKMTANLIVEKVSLPSEEIRRISETISSNGTKVPTATETNISCESNNEDAQEVATCVVKAVRSENAKRTRVNDVEEEPPRKVHIQVLPQQQISDESSKRDDDRSVKSFTNLTADQRQKILTEAKLLANIDEMTALGKQKILNELGLDASQVDIRQLAQENRQILETLNKKIHNESKDGDDISIKHEDLEQYLVEESNQDHELIESEEEEQRSRLGTIKVRDIQTLSNSKNPTILHRNTCESAFKLVDVRSLKESKGNNDSKIQNKKLSDDSKKLKLEPVIELMKLDGYDNSIQKLNKKLGLSDEVSLLMVDGERKAIVDGADSVEKTLPTKKLDRPSRARKSMPNRTRQRAKQLAKAPPKNINVISVDTENSNAQTNLLKRLCAKERKEEHESSSKTNKKTVLITTNDKGIKNVDVTTDEIATKKLVSEMTTEGPGSSEKGSDVLKDSGSLCQQKNLTVVANSHLILTNNGPTFLANQNNQSNLALTQNNLGQLSLVHLTNLTSGIQTNFLNLTNDTIGLNNSIGTIYASPSFSADSMCQSVPSAGSGPVLVASNPTSLTGSAGGHPATTSKSTKGVPEASKLSSRRINSIRPNSGISVKSPASLGLITAQSNKLPPVVSKTGDESFVLGEVGSVTAELNRHSIKMAEYMRATIEDILRELSNQGSLEAKYKSLTIEMEKLQWRHQQEIMELKHHSERSLIELRTTLESEKQKCLADLKNQLEARHQKIITETKNKQWCANCGKEALFYCCWNTSYCDYPCQQQHWPGHMSRCAQLGNNVQASNQLQAQSQGRRSSDPPGPQLPINITIRPQHYFM